jgi:hypothetical protein
MGQIKRKKRRKKEKKMTTKIQGELEIDRDRE